MPAEKGELVYYAGTDSSTLERMRPVLEHSSKDILHAGGVGAGTVVKLVTNMISATMVQSLSEALAITQAYGISPQLLGQAISRNVIASPLAAFKLPLMAERDFSTHFSLDNMRKDGVYAQELAGRKRASSLPWRLSSPPSWTACAAKVMRKRISAAWRNNSINPIPTDDSRRNMHQLSSAPPAPCSCVCDQEAERGESCAACRRA